jgi:signal transduction histidine kinase
MVAGAGVWAIRNPPAINATQVIAPVATTDVELMQQIGRNAPTISPSLRQAMQRHQAAIDTLLISVTRTQDQQSRWPQAAALFIVVAATVMVILIAVAAPMLSRQYASPLNEIVEWTRRIQRREPVPDATKPGTMPELVTLQRSLYELQQGLERARASELEAERLRAFGEVARRVAHEMKNPLTPIRLAVRQLAKRAPSDMHDELDVIAAESARLEGMAREFAELGRLPEGVAAPVDLRELLEDLLRNTVPEGMARAMHCDDDNATIEGYYDPLRRAFSNVLRNAVEACDGHGTIAVAIDRQNGRIRVALSDDGPGVPEATRERIFEPYYTEKGDGTGLGLAIVRQTIEQHHGTIAVADTPGGGATFLVHFPA